MQLFFIDADLKDVIHTFYRHRIYQRQQVKFIINFMNYQQCKSANISSLDIPSHSTISFTLAWEPLFIRYFPKVQFPSITNNSPEQIINLRLLKIKEWIGMNFSRYEQKNHMLQTKLHQSSRQLQQLEYKYKEMEHQFGFLKKKLNETEQQLRKQEERQFILKSKIEQLSTNVLLLKKEKKKIENLYKEKSHSYHKQEEKLNEKISQLIVANKKITKNLKQRDLSQQKNHDRKLSGFSSTKETSFRSAVGSDQGEDYEKLVKQVKQLKKNQSTLIDYLTEKDSYIEELEGEIMNR